MTTPAGARSALDAAAAVLEKAGGPLHYREITKRMLEGGLWATAGKTPEATVNAQLGVDIKKKGNRSRFARTGKGTFALNPHLAQPAPVAPLGPFAQSSTLSFTDAAERVLNTLGDRKPMHYKRVTELAMEHGWLVSEGQTPDATMYSQVLSENRRKTARGELPRFTAFERGLFGLTKWSPTGLAREIEQHNEHVRRELHKRLRAMPRRSSSSSSASSSVRSTSRR